MSTTLITLLYILFICNSAQILVEDILNDEDDYDIPNIVVPQTPSLPSRKNTYQRVEDQRETISDQTQAPISDTNETPTLFDYETPKDYEDTESTKNTQDYMAPDNTLVPQPTPGVTVDHFIKTETINVQISECIPDKTIIDTLLKEYQRHKTPAESGVKVWIEVWLQDMTAVNERTADFEAEIYLSEIWMDHALNFEDMKPCRQNISLNYDVLDKIWKPNTVFINSKLAHIHKSPFPNIFILIYSNGTVWVNERIQVKGPCDMEFSSFPMDRQTCLLTLESYNYNNQEVDMQWSEIAPPFLLLKDPIVLPDFILSNYSTYMSKVRYPAGTWNELTMTFTFSRRFGWYALQAYFPTYMTIFISWISFCLGAKMIPARTMLGVNSLLALIFQFGNVMRNLPRVSYIKALDVWVLACLLFVFASLIELAIVGIIANKSEKPIRIRAPSSMFSSVDESQAGERSPDSEKPENAVSQTTPKESSQWYSEGPRHVGQIITSPRSQWIEMEKSSHTDSLITTIKEFLNQICQSCKRKCRRISYITTGQIDEFSLYFFATTFSIFNIVYWSFYWTRDH